MKLRVAIGMLMFLPVAVWATPRAAGSSGYWTNSAIWGGTVPQPGDDVTINGFTVTNDTAVAGPLGSLSVGGTLVFSGWDSPITVTNVSITGTVTHVTNSAAASPWTPNARVFLICTNLFVASGGSINANAKGYGHNGGATGYGPGGGTGFGGGGYGGPGGKGGTGGPTYGSIYTPTNPGSGGGAQSSGFGGGAVLIQGSGVVTVNGVISANGANGNAGGGSGGSVCITCNTFYGTNGVVSADGGSGSQQSGGGGGGGRIAVVYSAAAQSLLPTPTVRFSSLLGIHTSAAYITNNIGDVGTLYLADGSLLDRTTIRHSGELHVDGLTNWTANTITFSNCALRIAQDGLVVVSSNDLSILGTNLFMCKAQLSNALITCGGNMLVNNMRLSLFGGPTSGPTLSCAGSLTVTNGGVAAFYGGGTNAGGTPYGAVVTIAGATTIATNSSIQSYSSPMNGGSPVFWLGNLLVSAGGSFDAWGKGYGMSNGPGRGVETLGGGCYGGLGAGGNPGSKIYGSSNAPVDPGSGAGSYGGRGGAGGGLVRVHADRNITVDGRIIAEGAGAPVFSIVSAGAGGGIYLTCRRFLGTGVLTAKGGAGDGEGSACGGGGGRIAVWRTYDQSSLSSTNVDGGNNGVGPPNNGTAGTIVWGYLRDRGTVFVIH